MIIICNKTLGCVLKIHYLLSKQTINGLIKALKRYTYRQYLTPVLLEVEVKLGPKKIWYICFLTYCFGHRNNID
jgi:hypothetical protein